MGWQERPGVRKCKGPWNDTNIGVCKIWCATDETGLLISWRTMQYDKEGWKHYNTSDRPIKMIHSTQRHNKENVNGWELRQAPPQQVTRPLTHPLPQVNHHCDGVNAQPGQARQVQPQQWLGPYVDTHHCTDDDGGSVSMLVLAPHHGYHLCNLLNLAVLHSGVNWHLHCCCEVS